MSEQTEKKFTLEGYYEKNRRVINIGVTIVIILSVGVYYYKNYYAPKRNAAAAEAIWKAQEYFANDSFQKAMNGDGLYSGVLDVASDYKRTKSEDLANYMAACLYLDSGKYEEALEYVNKVSFSDELLSPLVYVLQGDCYSEMEDYEKAVKKYMKAANMHDNEFTTPYALQKAAIVYRELDQWEKALGVYERIRDDYGKTRFAEDIDKFVSMAQARVDQ